MGYYGVLVKQGRLIGVGVDGTRQVHQSHKDDATKYELCDECTFSFTGKRSTDETLQPFSVTVHSNGSKLWRRTDMLGELPLLIRKIIQSFMSKPFAFMWWEKAKAEITVGDEKEELESFAYRESTILNDK